jgi:ABC-2 type transport system ATP-binding protein
MNKKKLLEVKGLSKNYGKLNVLNNINFDLFEGEILGVLGYSGSGKTTLLNVICGLISTNSGKVIYYLENGEKVEAVRHFAKGAESFIGFSTQEPSFYKELSIKENLYYFAQIKDIKRSEIPTLVKDIMGVFKLLKFANIKADELSGGMKKRLDLACSMIDSPKVLILDEPTESLDFSLREELKSILKKIKKDNIGIIFISHVIEEIESIADKVLFLDHTKTTLIPNNKNLRNSFLRYVKND